jgi:uncharacterized protein (DUF885 family)
MLRTLLLCTIFLGLTSVTAPTANFSDLVEEYQEGYTALDLPWLSLSYVENFQQIRSPKQLKEQQRFFAKMQTELTKVDRSGLSQEEQILYSVMVYETELNLDRLKLETQWQQTKPTLQETRLYDEHMGKEWYRYYLKKWVDKDAKPDSIYQFGLREIEKVKTAMADIRQQLGLDPEAFTKHLQDPRYQLTDHAAIQARYKQLQADILPKVEAYFPHLDLVPTASIAPGRNPALAIVPAYYNDDTFYYNFFGTTYDTKAMGWIYLHEAVPGHHYQRHVSRQLADHALLRLFSYPSYVEGWGAYIEQYGYQLGAFQDPMDHYGQLQWDLIRSTRVALDVALNYYGWSDERALAFWNSHIPDQEDIGHREIARMKRWPAQVITYKYGKAILDHLRADRHAAPELKAFHAQVLQHGVIPLSILQQTLQPHDHNTAKTNPNPVNGH